MRLCVVAPNEAYLQQAGVRIRYSRLSQRMAELGVTLAVRVIGDMRRSSFGEHDVFLISKCYDARALLLARMLATSGRRVGVDLFDDYFSHGLRSRFVHHRAWLRGLSAHLSFVLCSTPRMAEIAADFAPGVPAHVLNDPFAGFDTEAIAGRVEAKLAETRATRRVAIGWFGIGDNPFFPVGLDDLHAFREALSPWRRHGYAAELSILTNARSLTASRLSLLRALPIPCSVEEWSETREEELIAQSLFCFLPTNAQNFSVAKSLNRAVTTLTGGAQALSAGFPLYGPLDGFVYRSAEGLVRDVEAGTLAMRRETLPALAERFRGCADPSVEAERFAGFLKGLPAPARAASSVPPGGHAVMHGTASTGDVHKFTQRAGQFSVGMPFSKTTLNHDIRLVLDARGEAIDAELADVVLDKLAPALRARATPLAEPRGKRGWLLAGVIRAPRLLRLTRAAADPDRAGTLMAFYPAIMEAMDSELRAMLPGIDVLVSETESRFWSPRTAERSPAMEATAHAS